MFNGFALNNIKNAYVGSTPAQAIYLGSTLIWPTTPSEHDYSKDYFTIVSLEDNNDIGWQVARIAEEQYDWFKKIIVSTDNGTTWNTYESSTNNTGTKLATLNKGDKLLIKGNNTFYGYSGSDQVMLGNRFVSSGYFKVEGNIMSLIYLDDFIGQSTLPADNAFTALFYNCSKLMFADNLILPATTLTQYCYRDMFRGCTSLAYAPKILPATTLVNECYKRMFYECSTLTKAPELPASTLLSSCYYAMFKDCSSLNYIKCLATDVSDWLCTGSWVSGVSSSGTFVKDGSMTSWTTGLDGIPEGWTVQNA